MIYGLFNAIVQGDVYGLSQEIASGVHVDTRNSDGATLLMKACECGNIKCVDLLIQRSADVNAQKTGGLPAVALDYAVFSRVGSDIIQLLLNAKASVEPDRIGVITPLARALLNGRRDNARLLLYFGAKLSNVAWDVKQTSHYQLFYASLAGCKDVLRSVYAALLYRWRTPRDLVREVCKRVWERRFDFLNE